MAVNVNKLKRLYSNLFKVYMGSFEPYNNNLKNNANLTKHNLGFYIY